MVLFVFVSVSGSFVTQTFKSLVYFLFMPWNNIWTWPIIFFFLILLFLLIEGEDCVTHNQFAGICVELPKCVSLIQLYNNDRSQNTINILIENQRNCGNRKNGRNPLMCCSDSVPQTTRAPPTSAPSGSSCTTPDNLRGFCIGEKIQSSSFPKLIK